MNFWKTIHRSVADPSFYKEVVAARFPVHLWYVVRLFLFCAVLIAIANTGYTLYSPKKNLADKLYGVFGGMSITSGVLDPRAATPIVPNSFRVGAVLNTLLGVNSFKTMPDSFVVIDTAGVLKGGALSTIRIMLTRDKIIANPGTTYQIAMPYTRFFDATDTFHFESTELHRFIARHKTDLLLHYFLTALLINSLSLCGTIFILAVTGFILSMRSGISLAGYWAIAFYAMTPAALGAMVSALSGTHFEGLWQIVLMLCAIVMWRGVQAATPPAPPREPV